MNADKTIYGRYGSRAGFEDAEQYVTLDGFKKACRAALALHDGYPANKKSLAGKTGPKPVWRTTERIPFWKGNKNIRQADGSRGGCIHCHQASDGTAWSLRQARQPIPDKWVRPFPMPDLLGLSLDVNEAATVKAVEADSPAAKGRFKVGDRITHLDGQPMISIADVQWVLQNARKGATIRAEVDRSGTRAKASLRLAAGWRRKDELWRVIVWSMRHRLLGTKPLAELDAAAKRALGVRPDGLALRVPGFPPNWVKNKNPQGAQKFKTGDVIVGVDNQRGISNESDLLAYLFQMKRTGQAAVFTVVRGGKSMRVTFKVQ